MPQQLLAILWAQYRITRNHFPRSSFGVVLSRCVSALWYLLFIVIAMSVASALKHAAAEYLPLSLSSGLLAVFAYMQIVPLVTTSTGWSLQIDKLQAFPIRANTLFFIEVVLRLTSAPEMLILLCGAFAGLVLRPDITPLAPLFLLLLVPFSLLLQLTVRDFILHSFARSRFREILTVLFLGVALVPQLLIREQTIPRLKPYALLIANGRGAPWHQIAMQSLGHISFDGLAAIVCWNIIAAVLARQQFMKSLRHEETFRTAPVFITRRRNLDVVRMLTKRFPDPFAAVFEKELRALTRMPRMRVVFGMACLFSILVFLPVAIQAGSGSFIQQNALPVTSLYGLLLLSDALLLNIFGFDRGATQLYFVTPPGLAIVIYAKNLAAILMVMLQSLVVPLLAVLFRMPVSALSIAAGFFASAVITIFLLSAGNLISVFMPRPVDPRSVFRKHGANRVQLWLLLCTLGMFLLVGFAFLARWAADRDWVLLAVLGFEFVVGVVVYRIAMESTLEHALSHREEVVAVLSRSASPLGSDQ